MVMAKKKESKGKEKGKEKTKGRGKKTQTGRRAAVKKKGFEETKKKMSPRGGRSRGGGNARETRQADISEWKPNTELGRKVKEREITNIDEILDNSLRT